MKKVILIICIALLTLGMVACNKQSDETENVFFEGTIIELEGSSAIVEPFEGQDIRSSADKISIDLSVSDDTFKIGDKVEVEYTGEVMESYPAQINMISIEKIN